MKLDPNDPRVLALPDDFESKLPTEEVIRASQLDRSLWQGVEQRIAGFDVMADMGARAWGHASQVALKRIGTEIGLPSSQVADVVENAAQLGHVSAMTPQELKSQLVDLGISIAVATTSWIPVIGKIAEAIANIAQLFSDLAKAGPDAAAEVLPPFSQYTDETDEYVVNYQALPALGTQDWTGLFLPRFDPGADWSLERRGEAEAPGYAFAPRAPGSGLGFIPGTRQITSIVNLYVKRDERLDLAWKVGDVQDVGDFYPSAAQLVTGLWGQLQGQSWQLFTVDTGRVKRQWQSYVGNAKEYVLTTWWQSDSQRKAELTTAMQPLLAQKWEGKWGRAVMYLTFAPGQLGSYPSISDKIVSPAMDTMRARQVSALGTLAVAYCSEKAAAFRGDGDLADLLEDRRRLLLRSPYRFDVDLDDVLDDDYARDLRQSGVGDLDLLGPESKPPLLKKATAIPIVPDNPKPPPEQEPAGRPLLTAVPVQTGDGGILLVVGGGLLLVGTGAYFLRKRKGRRG